MKENILKKYILFISIIIFIILLLLSLMKLYVNSSISKKYDCPSLDNTLFSKINIIVVVGDSRMELIEQSREKLKIPNNIVFDAKSGATISWFNDKGIPNLYKIIKNDGKYKYHIVFNLGVNDLNNDIDIKERVEEYFELYKDIIEKYENMSFYFLSVNPVDEDKIYNLFSKNNKRTNNKVEIFNNEVISLLKKDAIKNIKYCDSFNSLSFELPDGLHYNSKTNKKIINYIIEDCIVY